MVRASGISETAKRIMIGSAPGFIFGKTVNVGQRCGRSSDSVLGGAVIGAVIDLGKCLNLLDQKYIDLVETAARNMRDEYKKNQRDLPKNKGKGHRYDCALINYLRSGSPAIYGGPYDSARAVFIEGDPVEKVGENPSAFHHQTHVQIAVYHLVCIRGYFWPQASVGTSAISMDFSNPANSGKVGLFG